MFGITFLIRLLQALLVVIITGVIVITFTTAVTWIVIITGNMIGFNTDRLRDWIVGVYTRE